MFLPVMSLLDQFVVITFYFCLFFSRVVFLPFELRRSYSIFYVSTKAFLFSLKHNLRCLNFYLPVSRILNSDILIPTKRSRPFRVRYFTFYILFTRAKSMRRAARPSSHSFSLYGFNLRIKPGDFTKFVRGLDHPLHMISLFKHIFT